MAADHATASPAVTWLRRSAAVPVGAVILVLAGAARVADATIHTPQVSGAVAPLSTRTALAAVAATCVAGALAHHDPIEAARAAPFLRGLRLSAVGGLVLLVALAFTPTAAGPDWSTARTALLLAAAALLTARYAGLTATAAVAAGYWGACLFAGVPVEGAPRWWAVPMQQVSAAIPSLPIAVAVAAIAVVVTTRTPRLPRDHRGGRFSARPKA